MLEALQNLKPTGECSPHLGMRVPWTGTMLIARATILFLALIKDATNLLVRKALLQPVGYSVLTATTGTSIRSTEA